MTETQTPIKVQWLTKALVDEFGLVHSYNTGGSVLGAPVEDVAEAAVRLLARWDSEVGRGSNPLSWPQVAPLPYMNPRDWEVPGPATCEHDYVPDSPWAGVYCGDEDDSQ